MFIYLNKKAQSTAEYVIILGLVVGAVVAMQTYVKRGLQGRVREATDFTDQGGQAANVVEFSGDQYEPYYLQSTFDSKRHSDSTEQLLTDSEVQRDLTLEHSERSGSQTITGKRHETVINE